jgi:tRNA pseudouridine65 synthase
MMTSADDSVVSPPPLPLRLVHDDRWLVAVDKPAGLLVHRTALDAQAETDLLTQLQAQLAAPLWPVHRLDKGTSGVLLLARDVETARALGALFAAGAAGATEAGERMLHKQYVALVRGWPAPDGVIDTPLARDPELPSTGQPHLSAATRWQVRQRLVLPVATHPQHAHTRLALVDVQPLTGRRHQIRRHFKTLAHPLIGDATHGKGPLNRAIAAQLDLARLWLHAQELRLDHPETGAPLVLRAEPGPEWTRLDAFAQPNLTA